MVICKKCGSRFEPTSDASQAAEELCYSCRHLMIPSINNDATSHLNIERTDNLKENPGSDASGG